MAVLNIIQKPSPNFDERTGSQAVDMLVLHYTGMQTGAEAIARLCDAEAKVSAHYVVEENGDVFQLVDEYKRAWHAGVSHWQGVDGVNNCSIGIEIVNPGHQWGYRSFPSVQMDSVIQLAKEIVVRHSIAKNRVVGHSDVAFMRKEDPGEFFNWQVLAENGVGLGVPNGLTSLAEIKVGSSAEQITGLQEKLQKLGYGLATSGNYNEQTKSCVTAFQRHWHQSNVCGEACGQTVAKLDYLLSVVANN